jgi:hypothetical protein
MTILAQPQEASWMVKVFDHNNAVAIEATAALKQV